MREIQYFEYIIIIIEVLMYTLSVILLGAVYSPLSAKYSAVEMTVIIISSVFLFNLFHRHLS